MKNPNELSNNIILGLTKSSNLSNVTSQSVILNKPSSFSFNSNIKVLLSLTISPFKLQFLAKQFIKHYYQFNRAKTLHKVIHYSQKFNLPVLTVLESRLDVLIFRLSFASSISHARQLIRSGSINLDNKTITDIHTIVKPGTIISSNALITPSCNLYSLVRPIPFYLKTLNFNSAIFIRSPNLKDLRLPSLL